MFLVQLKTTDGTIFEVNIKDSIINASALKYNNRYFFFKNIKNGKVVFEEGKAVFIFEDEIKSVSKEIYS